MEPQVAYKIDIVREERVLVGVITRPDETDRYYTIPHTFEKTISYNREIEVQGFVHVGGEQVYSTAVYNASLDPLESVVAKLRRLGTGVATFVATEKLYPIILTGDPAQITLKSKAASLWRMNQHHYYTIPLDWFNLSTEEGKVFFEKEIAIHRIEDHDERMAKLFDAARMDEMERFRFNPLQTQTLLYTSEKSPEDNIQSMVEFLQSHNQSFDEDDIRACLYESS